jgi:hypothetical protein
MADRPQSGRRLTRWAAILCALVLGNAVPPPAHAECAWVLWATERDKTTMRKKTVERVSAHSTRNDCLRAGQASFELLSNKPEFRDRAVLFDCWPDTIDLSRPPGTP